MPGGPPPVPPPLDGGPLPEPPPLDGGPLPEGGYASTKNPIDKMQIITIPIFNISLNI